MQLYDLIAKLKTIDEGVEPPVHYGGQGPEGAKFDLYMQQRKNANTAPNPLPIAPKTQEEGLEIMPMMPGQQGQQDNVSMSINVNGQGEGGIRSIMNILRDIEGNDSHGHQGHEHDPKEPLIGDMVKDMHDDIDNDTGEESPLSDAPEEEMEEANENDDEETWANSAHGDAGHHVHGVDAVTFSGDDMNSKGKISPVSRAPGTNSLREPSNFDESLVNRLSAMYQEIKEAGDKKTMSRAAKGVMKYGKDGMQALAKAGKDGKDLDKVRDKYNKYD